MAPHHSDFLYVVEADWRKMKGESNGKANLTPEEFLSQAKPTFLQSFELLIISNSATTRVEWVGGGGRGERGRRVH